MKLIHRLFERVFNPRKFWERRANALPRNETSWSVGRTDIRSYDMEGRYVHYVYPPDVEKRERIAFRSLRGAVLCAERMNTYISRKGGE